MKKPFSFRKSFNKIKENGNSLVLITFLIIVALFFFSPVFFYWKSICSNIGNKIIELYTLIWSIFVSLAAVILYLKRDKDDSNDYLIQNIEILDVLDYQKIRTSLSNPTPFNREIYFSCLIITKEGADILKEVNDNLKCTFTSTNTFSELRYTHIIINNHFAFIPITYYFEENINVGNEKLLFELMIDSDLNAQNTNNYNVRFFVFRPKSDSNSYHRSVSAVFKSQNLTISFSDIFINNDSKIK